MLIPAKHIYNWDPTTQMQNWFTALGVVASGLPGARAKVMELGDSNTEGHGSEAAGGKAYGSHTAYNAERFTRIGVNTTIDNFQGTDDGPTSADPRVVWTTGSGGTANGAVGIYGVGGAMCSVPAGNTITFTPTINDGKTALNQSNRLSVYYLDGSSGAFSVTVDGTSVGSATYINNNGATIEHVFNLTMGAHASVVLTATSTGSNQLFVQGMSLWNSLVPALEFVNAGVGGSVTGDNAGTNNSRIKSMIALAPQLCIYTIGNNDVNNNGSSFSASTTQANLISTVTQLQAANCDVLLCTPTPFGSAYDPSQRNALRTAFHGAADSCNVAVLNLFDLFGGSFAALSGRNATGGNLTYDNLHETAAGYFIQSLFHFALIGG